MLNQQSRATELFSTATAGFLFFLHLNLSQLLLKRMPGLLPDFPNLIMESSEDRSDWSTLPGGSTSARRQPCCSVLIGVLWRCQSPQVISRQELENKVFWSDAGPNGESWVPFIFDHWQCTRHFKYKASCWLLKFFKSHVCPCMLRWSKMLVNESDRIEFGF